MIPSHHQHPSQLAFELQPIVDARTLVVFGHELLYRGILPQRWQTVDFAVLTALRDLPTTAQALFINLCNESVLEYSILDFVPTSKRATTIFELSEAFIARDEMLSVAQRVNTLTHAGLKFALDDFGNGLDGLLRLSVLEHIAIIKLDRVFLQTTRLNRSSQKSLLALIGMWHSRGIKVVAEGIENNSELAFARLMGADYLQGFLIDDLIRLAASEPSRLLRIPA